MSDPVSAEGLREALDSITTVEDRRPAHRGKVVTHYVDEVHSPDEPCRFCAALATPDRADPERGDYPDEGAVPTAVQNAWNRRGEDRDR